MCDSNRPDGSASAYDRGTLEQISAQETPSQILRALKRRMMLEIFAIPFILVTGLIGWAIFEPLIRIDEPQSLSRAKVAMSDLFSIALPVSVIAASARLVIPKSSLSLMVQSIVIGSALVFAATALVVGLYLIPKTLEVTFLKRITVIGVISPFGILLTLGWAGFLTWACVYSVMYLAPAMIILAAATQGLRMLTLWVCQGEADSALEQG